MRRITLFVVEMVMGNRRNSQKISELELVDRETDLEIAPTLNVRYSYLPCFYILDIRKIRNILERHTELTSKPVLGPELRVMIDIEGRLS